MIKKENLDKTNAWPIMEAKKMLRERKSLIEKKGKITLQTGYGPSGLPHIGTFGEVARTSMMVNALKQLTDFPTEIITFSDDMDGLRKIPDNVPEQKLLEKNLHKPLTQVPDPFGKFKSFGEHNNEMLKDFLNNFNFNYTFKSSTSLYKSGFFNPVLQLILDNYDEILNIILPTLGKERQKTYSPFLPICPESGHVLEIPVIEIDKTNSKIIFDNNGKKIEQSILDGHCKLQWKVDWAMRWYALDVDFEMYGKDLIESAILSSKIIKLIGKINPSGFAYELFLDEKGEKISKSKGNGITIDQWLKYASPESLSLFMYQNPKRAKKLYKEVVPKAVDEYLDFIERAKKQDELQLLMNPLWHVHNGKIPKENFIMSFSMLLNLVETSNADSKELLWKFVKKYKPEIDEKNYPIFDRLVEYAIKYFNDVIKSQKDYKKPNEIEKIALESLIKTLEKCNDQMTPEDIQTLIYSVGKENGYSENLRDWFKLIYQVVFGDENGPRMGFFISFFGVNETKELIIKKIK
ncbi:lysine--tRNA ligase [Candidatus Pelagibacter communis]|uniref:lysine--tRNA ligase n=1 Tax=Pelagibacter ubique TaxID=198252 RepID=UPI00094BEF78|nr:lysine--tRNA ligase [Candidatus Pelagibacter ubique]